MVQEVARVGSTLTDACTSTLPLITYFGGIFASFFPWPAIVIGLLFVKPVREALLGFLRSWQRFREIEVAGVRVAIDAERAGEYAAAYTQLERQQVQEAFDKQAKKERIPALLERLVSQSIQPKLDMTKQGSSEYRATIHVSSVLEDDELYQIVEYFPDQGSPIPTRGRYKSFRFGIIGKAWRSREPEYDPEVSQDYAELVKKWGMTPREAQEAGKGRESFLAVPLLDQMGQVVGVIYFDVKPAHAFASSYEQNPKRLGDEIQADAKAMGLDGKLEKVVSKVRQSHGRRSALAR